jgi:hypothetical protein
LFHWLEQDTDVKGGVIGGEDWENQGRKKNVHGYG